MLMRFASSCLAVFTALGSPASGGPAGTEDITALGGPYLGQEAPRDQARIFLDGSPTVASWSP